MRSSSIFTSRKIRKPFPIRTNSFMIIHSFHLFFSCLTLDFGRAFTFVPQTTLTRKTTPFSSTSSSHHPSRKVLKGSSEDEEWRSFRAKLVQNGLPSIHDSTTTTDENESSSSSKQYQKESNKKTRHARKYAHECTPLVEVGTILISIPTTDLCQALEQQYWHRAVVLVTEVARDVKKGDAEKVPEDQLAQGANRGRWSYRGILLNRFTDLAFDNETNEQKSSNPKQRGWKIHRGGDLLGLNSSDGHTEFLCLHQLSLEDPNVEQVSTKLVGDLALTSLSDAKFLCENNGVYNPDDFYTYGGFCSWRPGQLELEMGEGRQEWLALSVDHNSILRELKQQRNDAKLVTKSNEGPNTSHGFIELGTAMWCNFLSMIHISESKATERLPPRQLKFYDMMLSKWSEDNLLFDQEESTDVSIDSTNLIGAGTLLRAKMPVSNDMLLYEQEFIRSTILVLEETSERTVGVILNHPLAAGIECVKGKDPIPLRYGGPIDAASWKDGVYLYDDCEDDNVYGIEDSNDDNEHKNYEGYDEYMDEKNEDINDIDIEFDDDSPFLWIHCDAALGARGPDGGGGTRLGNADVWLIKEDDVVKSLQSGFLCLEDVMVFNGVCIWEKDCNLGLCGGGLREQVDALKAFEIIESCNGSFDSGSIDFVWDTLINQKVLVKETLEKNLQETINAWECCNESLDLSPEYGIRTSTEVELADAALWAWVGVNLLGDPLGTLVQI